MGRSRSRSTSRTAATASSGARRRRDDASPSRRSGGDSSSRRSRRSPSRSRSRSRSRRHRDAPSSSASATDPAPPVRAAQTVEKNGEISMSVEETNRVRAALGLKPLSLGPKAASASVVSVQKSATELVAERERAQLEKQLAQSKTRRALAHKLDGASLGEQLQAAAGATSALDWVQHSRVAMAKEAATAAAQQQQQDAYDASSLAGMVVGHDVKAFEAGDDVVLTLKDTRVLAADGRDLNDAEDELVNVTLSERDRRVAETQRAARAFLPAYSGVDDDEFVVGDSVGRRKKQSTRLLAQYDDEQDRDARRQAQKFTLDSSGSTRVADDSSGGGVYTDDTDADAVVVVSLAMDKTKRIDEFFTQDEIDAQFAKRKTKKLRRKKKMRTALDDDTDAQTTRDGAGDGTGDAASLVRQLEAEALKNASNDRGRRRRRVVDDDDDDNDSKVSGVEEANLLRFQEARERANATATSALSAMKKRRRVAALDDADGFDDAVDLDLSASLARTRRLAQLQTASLVATTTATVTGDTENATRLLTSEDRIAALVSQTIGTEPAVTDVAASTAPTTTGPVVVGHVFGVTAQEQNASGNAVVFNDATDFESRLRNAMEQRSLQFQAAAAGRQASTVSGTQSVASSGNATATAAAVATTSTVDGDEEMKRSDDNDDDKDNDDEETKGDGEVWGEEQPLVGAGMAATLALLRKTGDLRETRTERQTGRANDLRERDVDDALRVKDGVKLDYRDEFGRLLTKKEAFRVLSYKFHGHEPGKKKKEKRIKQLKEELAAQKLLSGEGRSTMMKVLEKKQKVAQQAHVVLSGGV